MRALITRPLEDAQPLAEALAARGIESKIEPLLTIVPHPEALPPLDGVQALLFTSANGVRAFAAAAGRRDVRVLAVGPTTAEAARAAGFTEVEAAAGDVVALTMLAQDRLDPAKGAVLHVSGHVVAGDLAGRLEAAGFTVRRAVLYEARTAEALSEDTVAALRSGALDLALFFSPRTAATFVSLLEAASRDDAPLAEACLTVTAVALSPAVADNLKAVPWRAVAVAPRLDQDGMLAAIDALRPDAEPAGARERMTDRPKRGRKTGPQTPENKAAPESAEPLAREVAPSTEPEPQVAETPSPAEATPAETLGGAPTTASGSAPGGMAKGVLGGVLGALIVLAVLGVALAVTWPRWQPAVAGLVGGAAEADRLAAIEGRLGAVESQSQGQIQDLRSEIQAFGQRLAELQQQAGGSEGIEPLQQRLTALEQRFEQAQAEPAASPQALAELEARNARLRERVAELSDQLASLQQRVDQVSQSGQADRALVLAVGQLREALRSANPYLRELNAVKALAGDDPAAVEAVQALRQHAETGVATVYDLRARFDQASVAAARATAAPEGSDWLDRTIARVTSLVTVRKIGESQGNGTLDALARAEEALARHDLQAAVEAVGALTGKPAEAMADWLTAARARLDAERALDTLEGRAIEAVAPVKG